MVKIRGQVPKSELIREIRFIQAAGPLGVGIVGYIYGTDEEIIGFATPFLRVIEPSALEVAEKIDVFH